MNSITGRVVSMGMTKTVIVAVGTTRKHPLYRKTMHRTRRLAVHNEVTGLAVGDTVEMTSCRPISKTKHYRVVAKIS